MSNRLESFVTLSVEVEIDVADILYICLGPTVGTVLNRIHSNENVGTASILIGEPSLKSGARDRLRFGDCLNRVASGAIPDENRGVVRGIEKLPDVLRSGERSRCECSVAAHVRSCLAKNTVP